MHKNHGDLLTHFTVALAFTPYLEKRMQRGVHGVLSWFSLAITRTNVVAFGRRHILAKEAIV